MRRLSTAVPKFVVKAALVLFSSLRSTAGRLFRSIIGIRNRYPFISFALSRFTSMIVLLLLLGLALFALMQLSPGDVVDRYVRNALLAEGDAQGERNILSQQDLDAMRERLGLNDPFYRQYANWLKRLIIERELGRSLVSRTPILFLIRTRMINSLVLNLISLVFLTIISFALGIYFSSKVGSYTDTIVTITGIFLHSIPSILLLILLQLFGATSGLFPVTAYPDFPFHDAPVWFGVRYLYHITLPLLGAFLGGIGGTLRYVRSTMLDQLGQPYITALRSRGVSERRVYFSHAFRNTLNPYITSSANIFASLFSGSLILEIIFAYPGIGRLMYEALLHEDINLVLANTMFISTLTVVGYIIADILLALVDPRIRFGSKQS